MDCEQVIATLRGHENDLRTAGVVRLSLFGSTARAGNFLRHEYDTIDPSRVWLMIEDDLAPLKAATEEALERLRRADE